jgi:RNA polymerase sigma factor for flagellar operon FliA
VHKLPTDTLGRRLRDDARAPAASPSHPGPRSRAETLADAVADGLPSLAVDDLAARRSRRGRGGAKAVAAKAAPDRGDGLLARYRRRPTVRLRNQLIERYRGMVEAMAGALAQRLPASVDPQDLVHAGIWGLIRALASYRPERGATFVAFMRHRVRGAMIDELRHMDRLTRLQRQHTRRRDAALERLRAHLQREPSDAELAQELGVSERRYRLRFAAEGSTPQPFDVADELPDHSAECPSEPVDRADLLRRIEATLPPIEWRLLRLHYIEGLSGKEVARKLRLSPARVCQIHGRVLSRLKARLGETM